MAISVRMSAVALRYCDMPSCDETIYFAKCVQRRDKSGRPANSPATKMSSSSASQCKPPLLSSTNARCSGVASSRRGNQTNGAAMVRPSDKLTHKVSSSNRIAVGEFVIPPPFKQFPIFALWLTTPTRLAYQGGQVQADSRELME